MKKIIFACVASALLLAGCGNNNDKEKDNSTETSATITTVATESYSEMSQAEQTALRYSYLLQATADAQGDFARTSSSYANQIRLLGENWTEFTGMVASQVIPVLLSLIHI